MDGPRSGAYPGWCSYVDRFGDAPDTEVMCGGINTKTPAAAAIWRQANILHFGFEEHPGELNATGKAILHNAIHYILKFDHTRPIAIAPSVFVTRIAIPRRSATVADLKQASYKLAYIEKRLPDGEKARLKQLGREDYVARFRKIMGHFGLDPQGKWEIDADLVALDVANDDLTMIERAAQALTRDSTRDRGRRVLSRYVPCGPDPAADSTVWLAWLDEHRPYLFFSESGQYRWYVDRVAKERGIPSKALRGARRARR